MRPFTQTLREQLFAELQREREAQDARWGGPSHDDGHTNHDWLAYMTKHLGRAVLNPWSPVRFRRQMVIVAALAVAAIEWVDRCFPEERPR